MSSNRAESQRPHCSVGEAQATKVVRNAHAAALEHVRAGIVLCDATGRITFANAAARCMAQMDPEGQSVECSPRIWGELFDDAGGLLGIEEWPCIRALDGESVLSRQCTFVRSDSSSMSVLFSAVPLHDATSRITGVISTLVDVTENKQRESMKRTDAVLAERRRIAEELHDDVAQTLNATLLYLGCVRDEFAASGIGMASHFERLCELTQGTLAATRRAIWSFSDDTFRDEDPGSALRRIALHLFAGRDASVHLSCELQPQALSPDLRVALVRIGREALVNVAKHAAATEIHVILTYASGEARLAVEDNGRGIAPDKLIMTHGGFGLCHVRARAEQAGGCIVVENAPQHGTRLTAVLPLDRVPCRTGAPAAPSRGGSRIFTSSHDEEVQSRVLDFELLRSKRQAATDAERDVSEAA